MEGFNQPPLKKAKTAKGEVASNMDTGKYIKPAEDGTVVSVKLPNKRGEKRKAPDEYSSNPNTVKTRERNERIKQLDPVHAGLEKAKNADRNAISVAQRKLRIKHGWPVTGKLITEYQQELNQLKATVIHQRTIDKKSAPWYEREHSLGQHSGHYAVEDDKDPNFLPVPYDDVDESEWEAIWREDDTRDVTVQGLPGQYERFRDWYARQPMSARHPKLPRKAAEHLVQGGLRRRKRRCLQNTRYRLRIVTRSEPHSRRAPFTRTKRQKSVHKFIRIGQFGATSPPRFSNQRQVVGNNPPIRPAASTRLTLQKTAFRTWQADWKRVMVSLKHKIQNYTPESIVIQYAVEKVQCSIDEQAATGVPQLNWDRIIQLMGMDSRAHPSWSLAKLIIRRYLLPTDVFHPQEIALYRNMTTHPKAVTKNKHGERFFTMPGPAELWSDEAMVMEEFQPLNISMRDGSLAAFWLVLSEQEDFEAFQYISLGGETPILYLNR